MHHPLALSAAIAGATGRQVLLLAPLALIWLALTVAALIDLARRETVRDGTLLWAIVIVFVGAIGPIAYFIVARQEV